MNKNVSRRVTNALSAPMLVSGVLVGSTAIPVIPLASARPVSSAPLPEAMLPTMSIVPAPAPSLAAQSNPFIPAGLWGPTENASFVN